MLLSLQIRMETATLSLKMTENYKLPQLISLLAIMSQLCPKEYYGKILSALVL